MQAASLRKVHGTTDFKYGMVSYTTAARYILADANIISMFARRQCDSSKMSETHGVSERNQSLHKPKLQRRFRQTLNVGQWVLPRDKAGLHFG